MHLAAAVMLFAIMQPLALATEVPSGNHDRMTQARSQPNPPVLDKTSLLDAMTLSNPQLSALLHEAVAGLRKRIKTGPPFKIKERLDHLGLLEKLMADSSLDIAKKYRLMLEAYRIELDYAKSVQTYRDLLPSDREERLVDFLSIGRLAFYYQTMDGHESGIWQNDQRRWQRLSSEDNEAIAQGLRIARKIEPPQLMVLPLFNARSTPPQGRPVAASLSGGPAPWTLRKVSADLPSSSESREVFYAVLRENAESLKPYFQQTIPAIGEEAQKALIEQLADAQHTPTIEELSQLFTSLQNLLDTQGRISTFRAPVYAPSGQKLEKDILRIGGFTLIAEGRYLSYAPEADKLVELPRQPSSSLLRLARNFTRADAASIAPVAIDPSAGETLQLLVQVPNLKERLAQGGPIGYLILILGGFAYGLCGYRMLELTLIGKRMRSQAESKQLEPDNPLGRLLLKLDRTKSDEQEVLYLAAEETIISEQTRLDRHLTLLKLVAAIAPMLGLLGTVTGMIKTFQTIALYGSGDPKLMSGGISEALVTTVEGLVVAIPLLLLHTLLSTKSRDLGIQLEAQASSALARRFGGKIDG